MIFMSEDKQHSRGQRQTQTHPPQWELRAGLSWSRAERWMWMWMRSRTDASEEEVAGSQGAQQQHWLVLTATAAATPLTRVKHNSRQAASSEELGGDRWWNRQMGNKDGAGCQTNRTPGKRPGRTGRRQEETVGRMERYRENRLTGRESCCGWTEEV